MFCFLKYKLSNIFKYTHMHIYIYVCVCVCMCLCVYSQWDFWQIKFQAISKQETKNF
jgi:hypothetical protein